MNQRPLFVLKIQPVKVQCRTENCFKASADCLTSPDDCHQWLNDDLRQWFENLWNISPHDL
jgi:hypothetical protein